jgi:hypothetical protein
VPDRSGSLIYPIPGKNHPPSFTHDDPLNNVVIRGRRPSNFVGGGISAIIENTFDQNLKAAVQGFLRQV